MEEIELLMHNARIHPGRGGELNGDAFLRQSAIRLIAVGELAVYMNGFELLAEVAASNSRI